MDDAARIWVAGHRGLVGSVIVRHLESAGHHAILEKSRAEVDLTDRVQVESFSELERPEYVLLAAARVGGILTNDTYPADFIREPLEIQTNLIDAASRNRVTKLLFLGSPCICPKHAPQPIPETALLTGTLEPTHEAYAVAKTTAGIAVIRA